MPVPSKLSVLLGLTGSVATVLWKKIARAIEEAGFDVDIVVTQSAMHFMENGFGQYAHDMGYKVLTDSDEWNFQKEVARLGEFVVVPPRPNHYQKGDPVLHIDLREQYSALVIAPCSANTLAKMANGLADNLLTSLTRAWDPAKPLIIAPAMNTQMWEHPITSRHLHEFLGFSQNNFIVYPQSKMLACNTEGMGAMANIGNIVEVLKDNLRWKWPLLGWGGNPVQCAIPVEPHPGCFASHRNGHTHTGVDLYADEGSNVCAVEDGVVVNIEPFTGPQDNSPWWENTDCLMVKGASGVVNYGEITPNPMRKVGSRVRRGDAVGTVKRVIRPERYHPEITGWKPSMLHIELYPYDATKASNGFEESVLRDPTPFLLDAAGSEAVKLTWQPT